MKNLITYQGAVMTWECDSNRHMNVMFYINKFEHAGRQFDLHMGLGEIGGETDTGTVVLEQNIKYLKEVFEDDLLYVKSSLESIGNKAFTIFHQMHLSKTHELVSTMRIVLVLFDKVHRKALPFPTDLKEKLLAELAAS
ncbi:MAG: thioesterase family protein [Bacteroidota bacterium]